MKKIFYKFITRLVKLIEHISIFIFIPIILLYFVEYGAQSALFLCIILFLIYIFDKKKLHLSDYLKTTIMMFILLFLFLNIIFVFYYNTYYDKTPLGEKEGLGDYNYEMLCEADVLNYKIPIFYRYHTPKSNPILPTLGIRYKETYKEERGHVVVYEKRSYFNIYVGEGKALCPDDNSSIVETLE